MSDLVEGFLLLMAHEDERGPVNLGNDGEFTMLELANQILDLTQSASDLVHEPLPDDDPTRRRPDLTLARTRLGYEPRVPLRAGLERTVRYFRATES